MQRFLLLTTIICVTATDLTLELMPEHVPAGAVCIDGTPGGFYYKSGEGTKWMLFLQGGGWCYDEEDCYQRSLTDLGSSKVMSGNQTVDGVMSSDCGVNPDFCNFNMVMFAYCDGNSFSGNTDSPVIYKNTKLYFRGKRILDAVLATLSTKYNLHAATEVILAGCSAGGLATYLHTEYFASYFAANNVRLARFKSLSLSGFFLDHPNLDGVAVYRPEIQYIHNLSNASQGGSLNPGCLKAYPTETWKCNFAQYTVPFIESPVMVLNSAYDLWQVQCIYTSELPPGFPNQTDPNHGHCNAMPSWSKCVNNPDNCNDTEIVTMNQYITDFTATLGSNPAYSRAGNGAFIHSCHTHCEAKEDNYYTGITIDNVTMQQAVSKWWNAPDTDPASSHHYSPCYYKTGNTTSRDCNPTCLV
eukprot:TRINITY_DN11361_c0_g1_i1.p1 TRINITY_DN11361_c0_g1~~TRINITY_DN11361_c0_g1_i1.p1  ORF type:complete len:430 (+),score=71.67 TRINITY_DN11361_c0_g1_i1:50-1291(+)